MISTILIDQKTHVLKNLSAKLVSLFPQISICGIANTTKMAYNLIYKNKPDLVFINAAMPDACSFEFINKFSVKNFETIYIADVMDYALKAIQNRAIGYIIKPFKQNDLAVAIKNAEKEISEKANREKKEQQLRCMLSQLSSNSLIGIPTLESIEFIRANEIIRCEGLQKCTRVITLKKTDIISSYNIGEFKRILEPLGFYAPHKSHLINLQKINRYKRDGTIYMHDTSLVPVSRRRRMEFLQRLTCIKAECSA